MIQLVGDRASFHSKAPKSHTRRFRDVFRTVRETLEEYFRSILVKSNLVNLSSNVFRRRLEAVVNSNDFLHLDDVVEDVLQVEVLLQQRVLEVEEAVADATNVIAHCVRFQLKMVQAVTTGP